MMKFFGLSLLMIACSSLTPITATAIRHVGGGGGISEQNLVFSFENSQDLIQLCTRGCELSADHQKILENFVRATQNPKAILYFRQNNCGPSNLQKTDWNICAQELDSYDLNQDGFLDLQESSLMLFQLFAKSQNIGIDKTAAVLQQLQRLLSQKSFNFVFSIAGDFEFQIFGFDQGLLKMPAIYIQTDGAEALQIDPELQALSTCSDIQILRPYLALNEMKGSNRKIVMVFPTLEYCGSDSTAGALKKRILEFNFEKGSIRSQR